MDRTTLFSLHGSRLLKPAIALARRVDAIGGRALLVGGLVRDTVLGLPSRDADIEVYGVDAPSLSSLLENEFPGKIGTVGRSFGIVKVFLGGGLDLDISIPRRDSRTESDTVEYGFSGDPSMNIGEAARRRDFTMNALAVDPLTGEMLDPFGGIEDLKRRLLRVTDTALFEEDPLRVYRAVQFAARFGLQIEEHSATLLRKMVHRGDLAGLSPERVTEEFRKLLLRSERPSIGFEWMRSLGILERYFPELHALIGVEQDPEWHPEGDVWIHTMMVLDAAARISRRSAEEGNDALFDDEARLQLLMGSLCHDLGKPATTRRELKDGIERVRALGHEEAGIGPTSTFLSRLCFGEPVMQASVAIARDHLKPGTFYLQWQRGELGDVQYANAVRKWLKRSQPVDWRVLLAASEADFRGRTLPGAATDRYAAGEHAQSVIETLVLDKQSATPLLYGRDLMDLGVEPGRQIGVVLRQIETARDEGRITSREEALVMAAHLIQSLKSV